MTIQELQQQLTEVIANGTNNPFDKVVFSNQCNQPKYRVYEVDYVLTKQEPNTLVLCWDDGMF